MSPTKSVIRKSYVTLRGINLERLSWGNQG